MGVIGSAGGGGGAGDRTRRRERFAVLHLEHAKNGESVLCLCESETIPMFVEFNPKEARGKTKVFKSEMSLKGGDELVNWGDRWSKDENVVYIYKNIERTCSEEIKRRVGLGPVKTEGEKSPGEFAKPLPGACLRP